HALRDHKITKERRQPVGDKKPIRMLFFETAVDERYLHRIRQEGERWKYPLRPHNGNVRKVIGGIVYGGSDERNGMPLLHEGIGQFDVVPLDPAQLVIDRRDDADIRHGYSLSRFPGPPSALEDEIV